MTAISLPCLIAAACTSAVALATAAAAAGVQWE
jgi:hypothetical protein